MPEPTPDEQRWVARIKELEWRAELARLVLVGDTRRLSELLARGADEPPLCLAWLIAPGDTVAFPGGAATNGSTETLQVRFVRGELHITAAPLLGIDPSLKGFASAAPTVGQRVVDAFDTTPADAFAGYLDELERLCDDATPGPWEYADDASAVLFGEGHQGGIVCEFPDPAADATERDAEFIAAARLALPKLIAKVRELQAELKQERDELERERVRLAGCAVACGRTEDPPLKQGDYGWSASYGDVIRLRERMEAAEKRSEERDHA